MITFLFIVIILAAAFCGAILGRMKGGWPDIPRPIEHMLFCTVFLFTMIMVGVDGWVATGAYALSVLFILTGHGQYFLDLIIKALEPERYDFIIKMLFGADPRTDEKYEHLREINQDNLEQVDSIRIAIDMQNYGLKKLYLRGIAGHTLTGWLVTLPVGIATAFYVPWLGASLAFVGAIKGVAYPLSHRLGWGTEGAEYITGACQWSFTVALLLVWMAIEYGAKS
jgi:hypothetical protein